MRKKVKESPRRDKSRRGRSQKEWRGRGGEGEFISELRSAILSLDGASVTVSGFHLVEMPSDGNCMFHSLADQLNHTGFCSNANQYCCEWFGGGNEEISHECLRERIAQYVRSHPEEFAVFLDEDDGKNLSEYSERMRSDREWGGHIELVAASRVLKANLYIFQHGFPVWAIEYNSSGGNKKQTRRSQRRAQVKGNHSAAPGGGVGDFRRYLFLSYHGECHYNSLHPVQVLPLVRNDTEEIGSEMLGQRLSQCAQVVNSLEAGETENTKTETETEPKECDSENRSDPGHCSEASQPCETVSEEVKHSHLSKKEKRRLAKMAARKERLGTVEPTESATVAGDNVVIL